MNLVLALMMMAASPKEPQVYYLNGKVLVRLHSVEMPNIRRAKLRLFVNSPYELLDAWIDSSGAETCLPEASLRKDLKLKGRWYTIMWETHLKTGSSEHVIILNFWNHKTFKKKFYINVEGSKQVRKPQGAN